MKPILLGVLVSAALGCSSSDSSTPPASKVCDPGQASPCQAASGCQGTQICSSDGSHFLVCVCPEASVQADSEVEAALPDVSEPEEASPDTSTESGTPVCSPPPECTAGKECFERADNAGQSKINLRLAHIAIATPKPLAGTQITKAANAEIYPSDVACHLEGTGRLSFLFQFDKSAATLKIGGSAPPADPSAGYAFVTTTVTQGGKELTVQPLTIPGKLDSNGGFSVEFNEDVLVPLYPTGAGAPSVVVLSKLALSGTLTASRNCLGVYNGENLDPAYECMPDEVVPLFSDYGGFQAFTTLESADTFLVEKQGKSLCVLVSGDAGKYGDGAVPAQCKRDASNKIVFQGNWCSTTNAAATSSCADAMQISGSFSANAVKISN